MADNSDNVLNILVKLGVVGQRDVAAVKQLLEETAGASTQLNSKIAENAEAARKAQEEFKATLNGRDENNPVIQDDEKAQQTAEVFRARLAGNKELLNIQKEQSLEAAKTSAETVTIPPAGQQPAKINGQRREMAAAGPDDDSSQKDGPPPQPGQRTKVLTISGKEDEPSPGQNEPVESIRDNQAQTATRAPGEDNISAGLSAMIASQQSKISRAQQDAINNLVNVFNIISGNVDNLNAALDHAHAQALTQQQETVLIKNQLAALASKSLQASYSNQ